MPGKTLWVPEVAYFPLGNAVLIHCPSDMEMANCEWGLEQKRALPAAQAAVQGCRLAI